MSVESSASQSEIIPAVMLAALIAVTGLEAAMIMATPHKAVAHTVQIAQLSERR